MCEEVSSSPFQQLWAEGDSPLQKSVRKSSVCSDSTRDKTNLQTLLQRSIPNVPMDSESCTEGRIGHRLVTCMAGLKEDLWKSQAGGDRRRWKHHEQDRYCQEAAKAGCSLSARDSNIGWQGRAQVHITQIRQAWQTQKLCQGSTDSPDQQTSWWQWDRSKVKLGIQSTSQVHWLPAGPQWQVLGQAKRHLDRNFSWTENL